MNRRRFLVATGSLALTSPVLIQQPVIAVNFDVNSELNKNPSSINSIYIKIENFSMEPQYLDQDYPLGFEINLTLDNGRSNQKKANLDFVNGEVIDLSNLQTTKNNVHKIHIDEISSPDTEYIKGTINIKIDHPNFEKTYSRNISIFDSAPPSGVSRWSFDTGETDGSTITDIWGSNNGSISGAETDVSGANQTYNTNESYRFDGSNDKVTMGDVLGDVLLSDHTLAFWAKYESGSTWAPFVGKDKVSRTWVGSSDNGWDYQNSQGQHKPVYTLSDNTTWHHFVVTCDSTSETYYLDGTKVATSSVGRPSTDSNTEFQVGHDGLGNYGSGLVDDLRVYSKELHQTEVQNLYSSGSIL